MKGMPTDANLRLRWSELSAAELRARAAQEHLVILPLGSIEQHGPHLPVDTDVFLPTAIAEEAARRMARTFVAPALPFGQSAAHVSFGGTLSLRPETMLAVVRDLVDSIEHRQHLAFGMSIDVGKLVVVVVNKVELIQLVTAETHNQNWNQKKK